MKLVRATARSGCLSDVGEPQEILAALGILEKEWDVMARTGERSR